jgi:hypothetical protein
MAGMPRRHPPRQAPELLSGLFPQEGKGYRWVQVESCRPLRGVCCSIGMTRPELDINLNQGYPSPVQECREEESRMPTELWASGKCRCGVYLPTGVSLPSGPYKRGPRD